jgi:hypothetical protein
MGNSPQISEACRPAPEALEFQQNLQEIQKFKKTLEKACDQR